MSPGRRDWPRSETHAAGLRPAGMKESALTYFCFIESAHSATPHMEAMDATSPSEAIAEARLLIGRHASAVAAKVFLGEDLIGAVFPGAD